MGRPRRIWSREHFHHVTDRGNWRDALYRQERDFRYFLKLLYLNHKDYGIEIASYCLMDNHYHLLIRSLETPLSYVMARINKGYADYYNWIYHVSGHVFESRFFSEPIFDLRGLAEVSRYIHLNPIEAKLVQNPQDYMWSSYRYFLQPSASVPSYLNLNPLLEFFPAESKEERIEKYCHWVLEKPKARS